MESENEQLPSPRENSAERRERVRQRIITNSLNIADGLTGLQEDMLALFVSELAKYEDSALEREEGYRAMLVDVLHDFALMKRVMVTMAEELRTAQGGIVVIQALEAPAKLRQIEAKKARLELTARVIELETAAERTEHEKESSDN